MDFEEVLSQVKRWAEIVASTADHILETSENKENENEERSN